LEPSGGIAEQLGGAIFSPTNADQTEKIRMENIENGKRGKLQDGI
jgi:hypothetical protein